MKSDAPLCYFLGANSPSGFYSYFDQLIDLRSAQRVCILKGGPGTGKSSFMRRIAAAAAQKGIRTEHIYCSSDPSSYDALLLPELGFALLDGTSPHTVDPAYPGVVDEIIPLGSYWDRAKLLAHREEILDLSSRIGLSYKKTYRYLGAAGFLLRDTAGLLAPSLLPEKLAAYVGHFAKRYFGAAGKEGGSGRETRRFLSAITPEGLICHFDAFAAQCSTLIAVEDTLALAPRLMQALRDEALARGMDTVSYYCPMAPDSKIEHLFFPSLGLGLVTSNHFHTYTGAFTRRISTRRFADLSVFEAARARVRFNRKCARCLLDGAVDSLREAKALHDMLELPYRAAMDFSAIDALAARLIQEVL